MSDPPPSAPPGENPRGAGADRALPERDRPAAPGPEGAPTAGDLAASDLARLLALVRRLRGPGGCPWDREQTLGDVRAYLVEEAHETAAAIDAGDLDALAGELGDLLFQAAFVATLGEESGAFTAGDAIDRSLAKMIARHPHVFGGEEAGDAASVARAWERRKAAVAGAGSLLDGVPASLPALTAAYRMTQKAAGVGFDWPDATAVLVKIDEELAELRAELAPELDTMAAAQPGEGGAGGTDGALAGTEDGRRDRLREELGDLLFSAANLGRKLGLDPEAALAAANAKFRRRFRRVEQGLTERGRPLGEATLEEMDELWEAAKREEGEAIL